MASKERNFMSAASNKGINLDPAKAVVFITRALPARVEARMDELFRCVFNPDDHALSQDELIEAVKTATILVPTVTDKIGEAVLSHAGPNLKLIANYGNGVDNIDVAAAHARGIIVTNTPNVLDQDTADMTMALMLAVPRRLIEGAAVLLNQDEKQSAWAGWSPTWMLGRRIWGKKLGLIGMGRVGLAVAKRARAFGLEIHYHNRNRVAQDAETALNATYWESLDQMLARVDIVSIHCPATPATFHLLSARRLALLKPEASIINTARGEVIDESAMIEALEQGRISGAGLDVFQHEPAADPRLIALAQSGKVVLLPHMGSATEEGRIDMGERVMINIRTLFDGHRPSDRVLPDSVMPIR